MENTAVMHPAKPMESAEPTVQSQVKSEHWFLQVVGGVTLGNTIVSSLALFWMILEYGIV